MQENKKPRKLIKRFNEAKRVNLGIEKRNRKIEKTKLNIWTNFLKIEKRFRNLNLRSLKHSLTANYQI